MHTQDLLAEDKLSLARACLVMTALHPPQDGRLFFNTMQEIIISTWKNPAINPSFTVYRFIFRDFFFPSNFFFLLVQFSFLSIIAQTSDPGALTDGFSHVFIDIKFEYSCSPEEYLARDSV